MGDVAVPAVVVLAAGSSRRLGRPKQLVVLDGRPVLAHVVDAALSASVGEVVVVVGHQAELVAAAVAARPVRIVVNPDHATGQASSLIAAIDALGDHVGRAVVLLGDQPRVEQAVIAEVAAGPGPLRRAVYRGVPGHPVAIDRVLWDEVRGLRGDTGARALIAEGRSFAQVRVDAPAPADLDTLDDLARLGADPAVD